MTSKTIVFTGEEIRADYSGGTNAWLRNDGTATVYASTAPAVTPGADGVVSIPAGQAAGDLRSLRSGVSAWHRRFS